MTHSNDRTSLRKEWPSAIILLLLAVVLVQQTRFLFVYPVPDTGMWFGDESWTMLTARAMMETGVARIPEAVASSLAHSNGLVNGSIWITGILYGVPAHFFASHATPVEIGRIITLLVCLVALALVYKLALQLTKDRLAASVSLLALVTSDAFAFSSHSARFDAATGLATLAYLALLLKAYKDREQLSARTAFAIPFLAVLSLAIYVHVPTLIALPTLYALWTLRIWSDRRLLLASLAGAIAGLVLIVGTYALTTGSLNLLGSGYNQYHNVASSLPIMHPFSWRVQYINTVLRALQVWDVAWPLVTLFVLGAILTIMLRRRSSELERFWFVLTALMLVCWCAFEGPAVFYNIHVLPVLAVSAAVLFARATPSRRSYEVLVVVLATLLTIVCVARQQQRGQVGARLVHDNAVAQMLTPVQGTVMVDEPALDEVAHLEREAIGDHLSLATKHFLLFGGEQKSISEILHEHNVKYLLLYSTIRYQSQLRAVADSFYTVIDERIGTFTDQARSYDDPHWESLDTIRLYRMK